MEGPNSRELQVSLNSNRVFSREAMSKKGPAVVKPSKLFPRATFSTSLREQSQGIRGITACS